MTTITPLGKSSPFYDTKITEGSESTVKFSFFLNQRESTLDYFIFISDIESNFENLFQLYQGDLFVSIKTGASGHCR